MPFRRFVTGGGGEESAGGSVGGLGTGLFTRNCVLSGKHSADMSFPLYIRTPGLISPVSGLAPEGLGYFESSEGTATNAFPGHNDLAVNTTYWSASSTGAWLAYHHSLRSATIRGYRFVTTEGYTPSSWVIEGSNDGENWTTIHEVTSYTWSSGKQVAEETVPEANRGGYTHHRFVVNGLNGTSVRIYSLQFWDAACPSAADFYLDADAENPCQLAFADGYNQDGTPKDILFTINTGVAIDILSLLTSVSLLSGNVTIPCTLFARYDPNTSSVSFEGETLNFNDIYVNPIKHGYMDIGGSTIYNISNMFDEDGSTYAYMYKTSSGDYRIEFINPIYTTKIYESINVTSGGTQNIVSISEDFGQTWVEAGRAAVYGGATRTFILDRPYYVTQVRFQDVALQVKEFRLQDATMSTIHKLSGGQMYEYNQVTETWDQVYKLPLGYFSLWKNPDGTAWEIGPFTPTHIPQMAIAPFFRKTSDGVAL